MVSVAVLMINAWRRTSASHANRTLSVYCYVAVKCLEPGWHPIHHSGRKAGKINIHNGAADVAAKMAVFFHVRAETCCAPVDVHQPDQPALYQRIQAVINRGHGDVRHLLLGSDEDFFCSRVVTLFEQHLVNVLALGCESKPAVCQALIKMVFG
jgi:hypothetical protein